VRFRLSPQVVLGMGIRVKKPGEEMVGEQSEMTFVHHEEGDEMDAYERLLGDAMTGDPILFAREDAVERAWEIVEPILGTATGVHEYEPGTWGPAEADRLTAEVGGWHAPEDHTA
jgi:glucose-6-phosphate 1-dehydrogenase